MGRPRSQGMTIRYAPHPRRVASWGVFWQADVPGERRKLSKFFLTEADAIAFRDQYAGKLAAYVAVRAAAAAPPPATDPPALPPATCTLEAFVAYWWARHCPPA